MNSQEKNIIKLYQSILSQKNLLKEQVDIYGIEDMVYNPVTGGEGEEFGFGYGYESGQKTKGYTWPGHGNHLHLSFRDRDVAIKSIDKAISMGLNARENPYSKDDPDGVQPGHKGDSWHFRLFPGDTPVTGAIDITGDKKTLIEFMKWVESEYKSDAENGAPLVNPNWISRGYSDYAKKIKGLPWNKESDNTQPVTAFGDLAKILNPDSDEQSGELDKITITSQGSASDDDENVLQHDTVIGSENDQDGQGPVTSTPETGDPVLKLMAKNIFQENIFKQKRLVENIEKIKNLLK